MNERTLTDAFVTLREDGSYTAVWNYGNRWGNFDLQYGGHWEEARRGRLRLQDRAWGTIVEADLTRGGLSMTLAGSPHNTDGRMEYVRMR